VRVSAVLLPIPSERGYGPLGVVRGGVDGVRRLHVGAGEARPNEVKVGLEIVVGGENVPAFSCVHQFQFDGFRL
jgi:hypothetical protein